MRKRIPAVVMLLMLTALPAAAQEPLEDPIPEPIQKSDTVLQLEAVAEGITAPLWATDAPGLANVLFVVDQPGTLWAVNLKTGARTAVLDVSNRLVPLGIFGPDSFDERGFLGVAFHPDFRKNGKLYTYTSEPVAGPADFSTMPAGVDANHQAVITEWRSTDPKRGSAAIDPDSARELLRVDEPQFNHNAGALVFDKTGKLLIAFGDGGGADDVDGQPFIGGELIVGHGDGNGQDLTNPLGSILRIDPDGYNSANGRYGIPRSNPFVGDKNAVDEIFAYGFRNPYRMSVDSHTGQIWVGDVGQNDIEEVDVVYPGGNYGWNLKEGSFFFDPNGNDPGFVTDVDPGVPPGLIDPVAEYDHDEGIAIVGGFVYRGRDVKDLGGRYVFGDFARTFSNDGRLFALDENHEIEELRVRGGGLNASLLGFGEDAKGELYVLTNQTGTPFGDTGVVWRLTEAPLHRAFAARLSGDQEVPPVVTDAGGQARFTVDRDRTELRYKLIAHELVDAVAAHVHVGPAGENGPVAAFLFSSETPVTVDRELASGVITAADLIGPLEGMVLIDLLELLETGGAYVNVHTVANPTGEIRGQIHPR